MIETASAEMGLAASHLRTWTRWGFTLSQEPLKYAGKFHDSTCHQELRTALINFNQRTEYVVVCYQCSKLFRTGLRVRSVASSEYKLREAAAEWKGGWE